LVGSLVHQAVQQLADPVTTREQVNAWVDQRWADLGFTRAWESRAAREKVDHCLDRFENWKGNRADRQVQAIESGFRHTLQAGPHRVTVVGRSDWVDGNDQEFTVVDFKTSTQVPTKNQAAVHDQLGVYQLVGAAGGFGPVERRHTAAELVYLACPAATGSVFPKTIAQPALADQPHPPTDPASAVMIDHASVGGARDYPTWVHYHLAVAAQVITEATYPAQPGDLCRGCPVAPGCPRQDR
jgi:RecB family exonuclease